jgi:hypothetical protein
VINRPMVPFRLLAGSYSQPMVRSRVRVSPRVRVRVNLRFKFACGLGDIKLTLGVLAGS